MFRGPAARRLETLARGSPRVHPRSRRTSFAGSQERLLASWREGAPY